MDFVTPKYQPYMQKKINTNKINAMEGANAKTEAENAKVSKMNLTC